MLRVGQEASESRAIDKKIINTWYDGSTFSILTKATLQKKHPSKPHILYSFRRCPYAIRARLAIAYSQVTVELREILLADKPSELIEISPKATVPILQLSNGHILDESLDIMFWAITKQSANALHLPQYTNYHQIELIRENDFDFKQHLDHYKYADRYPEHPQIFYRKQGEFFLTKLEKILSNQTFLMGRTLSIIDYAIFPFVRQFAYVDKTWFDQSRYLQLKKWLNNNLEAAIFSQVMQKTPQWKAGTKGITFPA